MAGIEWPRALMPPAGINIIPMNRRIVGPVSLDNTMQQIGSGGGHWQIEYQGVPMWSPDQIRTWRSISSRVNRGITVSVPIYDQNQQPYVGVYEEGSIVPHDDGTYFDDGTGYLTLPITAESVAAVALRATEMQVQLIEGGALMGGEYFSIRHGIRWGERLYLIETVEADASSPPVAGLYTITFSPPLREAVVEGIDLNFADPRCTCWLAQDQTMGDERSSEIMTRRNVTFVEAFP